MWPKRDGEARRPSALERDAAQAEAIVFSMPEHEREQALAGIEAIVHGAQQLFVLPDKLVEVLWAMLCRFVVQSQIPGQKPQRMLLQLTKGAPRLLARYEEHLKRLVG